MEIPLSDADIRKYIPNVITAYDDLSTKDFTLPIVLLYETGPHVGHWVLIHQTPEGVEFFDPYGYKPDQEFEFVPSHLQKPHTLARLLAQLNNLEHVPIHYNDFPLQSSTDRIATCGRWSILRHLLHNYKIDDFKTSILKTAQQLNLTPDQLVTLAVPPL